MSSDYGADRIPSEKQVEDEVPNVNSKGFCNPKCPFFLVDFNTLDKICRKYEKIIVFNEDNKGDDEKCYIPYCAAEYKLSGDIKFIDIKEFREEGYLQEVNRLFFHRLGLALSVKINDDGTEELGGIWDYREDPDGMSYGDGVLSFEKADNIQKLGANLVVTRKEILGFDIQPIEEAVYHD